VFWKIVELVVRVIYFRRFAQAKKIGAVVALLGEGRAEEALARLDRIGQSVHQSILPLFVFTRGKVLLALRRTEEAEAAFRTGVLIDPRNARSDLELAVLEGSRFRFDECRKWLMRAKDKEDVGTRQRAEAFIAVLDAVENGERAAAFSRRARAMASKSVLNGQSCGLPADMDVLTQWIAVEPDGARELFDEIALLIGQGEVEGGGVWKPGFAIEDSRVIRRDGTEIRPFDTAASLFNEVARQNIAD